jgi:hypothetical protein
VGIVKSTPGPWKWFQIFLISEAALNADGSPQIVLWPGNALDEPKTAAELLGAVGEDTEMQARENALLFAAAPTMYDELKKARDNLQMMVSEGILEYYDFAGIDAAIYKAEGGEG